MSKETPVAVEECPHCRRGPEVFRYMSRKYVFDVDMARSIVSDGRNPIELEPESVQYCVDTTRLYKAHLAHVDVQYPGIIAWVFYTNPDGNEVHGHVLIDGNHRAARCVELGRPYFVYILTEEESRRILLKSPTMPEVEKAESTKAKGKKKRRPAKAKAVRSGASK